MAQPNGTVVNGSLETQQQGERSVLQISEQGDIVLRINHSAVDAKTPVVAFKVSSGILKTKSKYFERLLEVGRFGEGEAIAARHADLRKNHETLAEVPPAELPTINIEDLGRISAVKSIEPLLTDFLSILHGKDLQTSPPVSNLANLAIVADRFDALDAVKAYVQRKKLLKALDAKTQPKTDVSLTEERVRQRLLVALYLDHPPWTEKYSLRMITKGWVGQEADLAEPLWWDLPNRVEEELAFRRSCILSSVQSLQSHFLAAYASRTRQCRLGYDSSPECDSFQFGEMVRFFLRSGTVALQPTIASPSADDAEPFDGDISLLLDKLKHVPEYQVDRNHSHCGIRTRIVPLLDIIGAAIQHAGVCGECWAERRLEHMWLGAKRPLVWRKGKDALLLKAQDHERRHASVRDFFVAGERDWS